MSQDTRGAVAARAAGLFLACLGFLPIVNWIPAGRTADWYGPVMQGFLSGGAIAIGVGLILAIASRRMPGIWPARWSLPAGRRGCRPPAGDLTSWSSACCGGASCAYARRTGGFSRDGGGIVVSGIYPPM